ncbi:MAG: putative polymerase sigma factor [Herminiimonas sp.]|nr:putative polymerase sigma factor [Herminiimonas sp.]MDB5852388.1 putative polymerase sigma factor [Herminiimonas sp.]
MTLAAPKFAPTDPSDTELAARIGLGDHKAFALLMRRHNRLLFRTARSIVKNDADAEDVLQEAYLLAYRRIGQYRGDAKLSTWLTRIVANEAIARARTTSRRAQILDINHGGDLEHGDTDIDMEQSRSEQPDESAMRSQARALLERKIDELPESFRTVFVLRALEEMDVSEVAISLDIPEATVRSRFFRARGLLRESLARDIDIAHHDAFSFDGARCDRIVAGVLARLQDGD